MDWRYQLRASILIVLLEISQEATREQQYILQKYLCFWKGSLVYIFTVCDYCRVKLSNRYLKFISVLPLKMLILYFIAILVSPGIAFWIRAFNSSSETSEKRKRTPYCITCLHPADTIYHLIESEYGSQSDCSICNRKWLDS